MRLYKTQYEWSIDRELLLCSAEEIMPYMLGMTGVNDENIFILGWTNPLIVQLS